MSPMITPPPRLLMGPGPVNVDPRVHQAAAQAMVGQFDPVMTGYMNDTAELYRQVLRTTNPATVLVDGTSRAGIEAVLVSLLTPGDRVLVPVFGRFGHLLVEIARRAGAQVHTLDIPWGEVADPEQVAAALDEVRPTLLAVVQGDTSTTMCQPLADLGPMCRERGVLLYSDVTASVAGNPMETDAWQLDAVSAGLQKCLGGPPGSAPVTLGPRAVAALDSRRRVEEGLRTADDVDRGTPVASNYLDLAQILDYWGERRLNHHTEATTMLYVAHETARILLEEGLDQAQERHARHGRAMTAGLGALGLSLFGDQRHRMHNVVAVHIPEGVDGDAVRAHLLADYGIEIGTSFGPLHGVVWRVGTMGYNARTDAVMTTLAALEDVLRAAGHRVTGGAGTGAAREVYG